jgi:hypothetical protein
MHFFGMRLDPKGAVPHAEFFSSDRENWEKKFGIKKQF